MARSARDQDTTTRFERTGSGVRKMSSTRLSTIEACGELVKRLDVRGLGCVSFPIQSDRTIFGCASWRDAQGRDVVVWLDHTAPSIDAAALAMWWLLQDEVGAVATATSPSRSVLDRGPWREREPEPGIGKAARELGAWGVVVAFAWLALELCR